MYQSSKIQEMQTHIDGEWATSFAYLILGDPIPLVHVTVRQKVMTVNVML